MASLFPPPLRGRARDGGKPRKPIPPPPKPLPARGGEHEAMMPNYRYRPLNTIGELVSGAVAAAAPAEVAQRIERLGLVLVDNITLEERGGRAEASRYPMFVLAAAGCVLLFFLTFVLPQFASVLQDFGAKVDPIILTFLNFSTFLRNNSDVVLAMVAGVIAGSWLLLRQQGVRRGIANALTRLPAIRQVMMFHRTSLFCRNLGVLLGSGVNLTTTLPFLFGIISVTGSVATWTAAGDRVRHGGKLSDALSASNRLPPMGGGMVRVGGGNGEIPALA